MQGRKKRGEKMSFKFNNERAIYMQIIERIMLEIHLGNFKSSEKIPSVRELAAQFQVNPNTIQKALDFLTREGLLKAEGTKGRFLTDDTQKIKQALDEIPKAITKKYVTNMQELMPKQDIIKYLENYMEVNDEHFNN